MLDHSCQSRCCHRHHLHCCRPTGSHPVNLSTSECAPGVSKKIKIFRSFYDFPTIVTPALQFAYFLQRRPDDSDLLTFRFDGSMISLLSGTPTRQFPYFPVCLLDISPTFCNVGFTKSILAKHAEMFRMGTGLTRDKKCSI